ncbi:EamA family transporter [Limnohabitans sp. T6-5]|uniref:DMT family transporter n=1 Tax=Limnohabitans sp. T6-5 TaxID=1100724 RepID=UPI000D399664|nr:DMT family transporter [Limnohabitans sp. T6-5]PUE06070.1 EamA family transporter [Limnohabitans sp. T6-5]
MNSRKDHLDGLAISLLLACCMFWGLQQVLVKSIMNEVAPLFQASLRCMGACVLLLIWCRLRRVRLFERDGSLWAGLLAGSLFAAEFACIYLGLRQTSASRLTVFLYTSPFWVAALVPLFVRSERLRPMQWVGMACAFVAVAFAMREGLSTAGHSATGDLLGLAAGALWGLTTVTIRAKNLTRIAPEKLLFYQIATTAVAVPWISLALGESWSFHWSSLAWGSMLAQTIIGAFASYLAWMWMLGRYPATKISVFVFLTPLFALLFGTWLLGESATPTLLAALGLVALGIVLVNRKPA